MSPLIADLADVFLYWSLLRKRGGAWSGKSMRLGVWEPGFSSGSASC